MCVHVCVGGGCVCVCVCVCGVYVYVYVCVCGVYVYMYVCVCVCLSMFPCFSHTMFVTHSVPDTSVSPMSSSAVCFLHFTRLLVTEPGVFTGD